MSELSDLEITRLCAEAMELSPFAVNGEKYVVIGETPNRYEYCPLTNDAQAMALVKKFRLKIWCGQFTQEWHVSAPDADHYVQGSLDPSLNRAICDFVAQLQRIRK